MEENDDDVTDDVKCSKCDASHDIRYIISLGEHYSEVFGYHIDVALYQCDTCKTVFIYPPIWR